MEEVKELLPFNILEKDLLEQYLNESLREGKRLVRIKPPRGKEIKDVEDGKIDLGDYEGYFKQDVEGENHYYEVLFFEPNDGWEATKESKEEEVAQWIEEKQGEGKQYIGKWRAYYIFYCSKGDALDKEEQPIGLVSKEEWQYVKNCYYIPCVIKTFGYGLLILGLQIVKVLVDGLRHFMFCNTALIIGGVGISYIVRSMCSLYEWRKCKKRRKEGIDQFNKKTVDQIKRIRVAKRVFEEIFICLITILCGIDIFYLATPIWFRVYSIILLFSILFYVSSKVRFFKNKESYIKVMEGIGLILWVSCFFIFMLSIISAGPGQKSHKELTLIEEEKYEEWPVIRLEDSKLSNFSEEQMVSDIKVAYCKTLFGTYYEYEEVREGEDLEYKWSEDGEGVKSTVYQCRFQGLADIIWKEMTQKSGHGNLPIEEKILKDNNVDQGEIDLLGTTLYIKCGQYILQIEGPKAIIAQIQTNGQLKACIKKIAS